jgi:nucleotidyltransferase/DNA polymerase involved in DNA repair
LVARHLTGRCGSYLAFNKEIAEHARRGFPRHVSARTWHSIAYGSVARALTARVNLLAEPPQELAARYGIGPIQVSAAIGKAVEVTPFELGRMVVDGLGMFCRSAEQRPEAYRMPVVVHGDTRDVASRIKQAVRDATGLSCSICVAPNKLLAKIRSDMDKPDGLTLLTPADIPTRIWPLSLRKVNGIGPKATERLATLGIATVGDLAAADLCVLQENFGRSYTEWLAQAAQGMDDRAVIASSEPKSIS